MNRKRVTFLALGLFLGWNVSHAGWVLGEDSHIFGILKVFQNGDVVTVQHCMEKGKNCKEVAQHDGIELEDIVNHLQILGAGVSRWAVGVAGLGAALHTWKYRRTLPRLDIVLDSLMAGALIYPFFFPVVDMLDLERLNGYRKIYGFKFLNDEDAVILLPNDSLLEIMENLGYQKDEMRLRTQLGNE